MSARRAKTRNASTGSQGGSPLGRANEENSRERTLVEKVRPWCLGAAAMLFVARPLWPSDVATLSGAGIPVAMAWLLLLASWMGAGLRDGRLAVQFRWLDTLLAALLLCFALTGLWGVYHAAPRPAINVVWEWTALAAAFWLVRQLLRTGAEARALVVVMIALAVAEAGFGLHQYFVSLPADRAAYHADPDGMLERNGLWFPPGSRERYLFEQRLASTEPFGTFELANSLGGLLAVWLVVACAAIWPIRRAQRSGWSPRDYLIQIVTPLVVTTVPLSATMILCKSRSALLAVMAGLAGIALIMLTRSLKSRRNTIFFVAATAVALLVAVTFGWLTGALDVEVISEIPKSFMYRWEYWQAAAGLLRAHPWVGAGPGNFRDAYPTYKLPEASEEIADPHNFAIELATSAGLPAMLAMLGLIAAVVWIALRSTLTGRAVSAVEEENEGPAQHGAHKTSNGAEHYVLLGGAAGFVFALVLPLIVGPVVAVPLAPLKFVSGLGVGAVVVAAWRRWILHGELRPTVPALGACVLLVNFLAAGGIGFPATAGSLWLLLALALGLTDFDRPPRVIGLRPLVVSSLLACTGAVLCYATAYRPVVNAGQEMAIAAARPNDAETWLLTAAESDPLDFQPWVQITALRFARWQAEPNETHWQAFEAAQARLLELRPQHSTAWMYVGDCYRTAALKSGSRDRWKAALSAYRQAVELYPNHALRRAKLAQALAESGDPAAAREQAEQALRFDRLTPHVDQKLSSEMRQVATRLAASSP